METIKVVSYLRVSTDIQDVEAQRIELKAYCSRAGFEVVDEFTDVMSGAKALRPGLDAMVARCRAGGIEAVVTVKLDRLGRSVLNVVGLVQKLAAIGVAIICCSQGIDTRRSNPCGVMCLQIMASFAEFERSLIVERTKAGLAAARARGSKLGRPSLVLVPNWGAVVAAWAPERVGGFRGLAGLLGGVSVDTARNKFLAWRASPEQHLSQQVDAGIPMSAPSSQPGAEEAVDMA